MKKLKVFLFVLIFALLGNYVHAQDKFYGEKITEKGATSATKLPKMLKGKTELTIKLTGKVIQSCTKKGCWMTMEMANGQKLMIKFKDYGFFVPKDLKGQQAIIQGVAKKEVIDIATLKHYAEDAGKSSEEIAKINKEEEKYTFEAVGVIVK
ncbi:MAG: DUF4920 domain-containing protein [Bacteroidetes bacterium]|nr:MAG: DUF4920 domain-containing protein [Bacteroidota bacterium]